MRNYKFRIYPTKSQQSRLLNQLEQCRWLYNHLLEQRKTAWQTKKRRLSCYDQQSTFTKLKKENLELKSVHSQVLQNVAVRVDLAYYVFFRRIKAKLPTGLPRFRGKFRYDSMTFPQFGIRKEIDGNIVKISKVGDVYMEKHRPIVGNIKTLTLKREKTGKWFAIFAVDDKEIIKIKTVNKETAALDVGLKSFVTFANGEKKDNPRFFETEQKALAKVQRRFSKAKTWKNRHSLALVHERIRNKRSDFHHQFSRSLVKRFGTIFAENLNINKMVDTHFCNKQILDAGWASFLQKLGYKAEDAGVRFEKVNPAFTSQDCSGCGCRVEKKLSERTHKCPSCGLELDRDVNAARNVLRLGLQSLAQA